MLNHPHSGIALKNGTGLPGLSFGTWHLTNPEEANRILTTAIEAGYRSFDSAQIYNNASFLGEAIAHCGIPREAFFLTSKIWVTHHSYEDTIEAVKTLLTEFRTSYLDALLIHWPSAHGDAAVIGVIRQSMGSGYKGITFDRLGQSPVATNESTVAEARRALERMRRHAT